MGLYLTSREFTDEAGKKQIVQTEFCGVAGNGLTHHQDYGLWEPAGEAANNAFTGNVCAENRIDLTIAGKDSKQSANVGKSMP